MKCFLKTFFLLSALSGFFHPADAAVLPLKTEFSPVELRNFIPEGAISAAKPGTALKEFSAKTVAKQIPGLAAPQTVLFFDKKAGKAIGCQLRSTIQIDIDRTYQIKVSYASDLKGLKLELHSYGFSTWGDTVGVNRFVLPPSGNGLKTVEFTYKPAPGAICVGIWFSAPGKETGTFALSDFSMRGCAWGGLPQRAPLPNAEFQVSRTVMNSKPINSFYHGPNSKAIFERNEFSGSGSFKFPLGAVLPAEKGSYRVDLILRKLGKGPVIAEYSGEVTLKEDALPELAVDLGRVQESYELYYQTRKPSGELVRNDFITVRKFAKTPLKDGAAYLQMPAREASAPSGFLTIDAGKEKIRPYSQGERIQADISAKKTLSDAVLEARIQDYTGTVLAKTKKEIKAGTTGKIRLETGISFPDVYEIHAELKDASGKVLDLSSLQIGYRTPPRAFVKPNLPEVYYAEELATPSRRYAGSAMNTVRKYVAGVKEHGGSVAGFGYDLASFNPLPGVYRFAELDERIAEASKLGLKSEVYLLIHGRWVPFADFERPADQNGLSDNVPSIASDSVRRIVGDAFAALAAYYRGNPDVVGFGHWGPFFDWYYRDGDSRHYDFSPAALAQWKEFSGAMEAPRAFARETDLSPRWRKWAAFRTELMRRWLIGTIGENVRKYEKERPLFAYTMAGGLGDIEALWQDFKRLNMFPAHGGSDSWDIPRHLELASQRGLIFRHESVAAPERHVIHVDPQIVHGLQGGVSNGYRPMWNVAWNIGFNVTGGNPRVKAALERRRLLLDVVREMYRENYERAPLNWAQLYSWDAMMLRAKTFQWNAIASDLFAGNRCEQLSSAAVSDRTPLENWKKYPLVAAFTTGVWTPETANVMKQYLDGGGTLSLILNDGNDGKAVRDAFGISVLKTGKGRVDAFGTGTLFPKNRKVVLHYSADYKLPEQFLPLLTDRNGTAQAWEGKIGRGRLLLFRGTIDHAQSKGYLEDILKSVGLKRRIRLSIGKPEISLMCIEFKNPRGDVMLWFYNTLLWNGHNRLLPRVASEAPTWDGVAKVTGRDPVKLQYFAPRAGNYNVERWNNGTWEQLGLRTAECLAEEGITTPLAPGENGIIKISLP